MIAAPLPPLWGWAGSHGLTTQPEGSRRRGIGGTRRRGEPGENDQRGQATVEVALALPVVVVVLLLVLQVALVGNSQVLVTDAAREGARAAALGASPGQVASVARATPGLNPARVSISVAASGRDVRVTVRYRSPTDVALVGPLLGEPWLHATVTMRREEGVS